MFILIACEESGIVAQAFIEQGFTNVFSCDMLETSGNYPNRHIIGDVLPILNGNCIVTTADGIKHEINTKFSLIIAFPPCTHLANCGAPWFTEKRLDGRQQQAINFFMSVVNIDCPMIAIENPVGIMSTIYRKPDQIIQPFEFGDSYSKRTCFWLKGLPKLIPTKIVDKGEHVKFKSGNIMPKWYADAWNLSAKERSKLRSKTFPGIAKALATQYTAFIKSKMTVSEWENLRGKRKRRFGNEY